MRVPDVGSGRFWRSGSHKAGAGRQPPRSQRHVRKLHPRGRPAADQRLFAGGHPLLQSGDLLIEIGVHVPGAGRPDVGKEVAPKRTGGHEFLHEPAQRAEKAASIIPPAAAFPGPDVAVLPPLGRHISGRQALEGRGEVPYAHRGAGGIVGVDDIPPAVVYDDVRLQRADPGIDALRL